MRSIESKTPTVEDELSRTPRQLPNQRGKAAVIAARADRTSDCQKRSTWAWADCGDSRVVDHHVGLLAFGFHRMLGRFTTVKLLRRPTPPAAHATAQRRAGHPQTKRIAKLVPTRFEQQRHVQHDRAGRSPGSTSSASCWPMSSPNSRMGQLLQVFSLAGPVGRRGKHDLSQGRGGRSGRRRRRSRLPSGLCAWRLDLLQFQDFVGSLVGRDHGARRAFANVR